MEVNELVSHFYCSQQNEVPLEIPLCLKRIQINRFFFIQINRFLFIYSNKNIFFLYMNKSVFIHPYKGMCYYLFI